MRLVNLTPHEVQLVFQGGTLTVPPSGTVARCQETTRQVSSVTLHLDRRDVTVPLVVKEFGPVEGLPAPEAGVLYIASALAAQAAWAMGRWDVVCPADLVRDEAGRVVGATALAGMPALADPVVGSDGGPALPGGRTRDRAWQVNQAAALALGLADVEALITRLAVELERLDARTASARGADAHQERLRASYTARIRALREVARVARAAHDALLHPAERR